MMRKIYPFYCVALLCGFMLSLTAEAVDLKTYYADAVGKRKMNLKIAMHEIIKDADVLSYGSGSGATWSGFYETDRLADNECRDRYSNDHHYFTSKGSAVSGMNIEHSFPKSWWGGSKNQAYCDIHHLMPSESTINSRKSNYGMGVVTDQSYSNGCTKIGKGSGEGGKTINLWEPADKWKGDFARAVFYMVTCYSNLKWQGTEALNSLENNDWPTLKEWAYKLYLQWNREDPVDSMEMVRNEKVYQIQGNRNPFIDFPNLPEFIWGDSTDVAFYIGKQDTVPQPEPPTPTPEDSVILLSHNFLSGQGDFTIENVVQPAGIGDIWMHDSRYGMKASGYLSYTYYATEAWLISPLVSCDNKEVTIRLNHTCNKCTSGTPTDYLGVYYSTDKENWTPIELSTWPAGTNWTYIDSEGTINDVNKVYFGFKYTSTESVACTWEIKNIEISAKKDTTTTVASPAISFDALTRMVTIIPADSAYTTYYTLDGTMPNTSSNVYTVPFEISKTTTVKALSMDANKASSDVTSLQCNVVDVYTTIEEMQNSCSSTAKQAIYMMDDVTVTGAKNDYLFIKDETGYFLLFKADSTLSRGDVISGYVEGALYFYNAMPELEVREGWGNVEQKYEVDVYPRTVNPAEITSDDACQYVQIKSLNYVKAELTEKSKYRYKFLAGQDTVAVLDYFEIFEDFPWSETASYTINAYVMPNNEDIQYVVLDLEDVTSTETGIDVVQSSVLSSQSSVLSSQSSAIYNLAGQRVGKLQKGVNIVKGKKVVL